MTTQTTARVAISGYHSGQIVTPRVTATYVGSGASRRVRVALCWHDAGERPGQQDSTPETFTGTVSEAERWLEGHGVRLDAQGIH